MENASKALIIAGAILISIMIISLGVLLFTRMSSSAKNAANMDEQEVANFNSKITPYIGNNISGSQVNALIQLVISINQSAINSGNSNTVEITYPISDSDKNRIYVNNNSINGINKEKRVKTGSGITYGVNATYSKNGLINEINVFKQN